jgi:hypothetical protein
MLGHEVGIPLAPSNAVHVLSGWGSPATRPPPRVSSSQQTLTWRGSRTTSSTWAASCSAVVLDRKPVDLAGRRTRARTLREGGRLERHNVSLEVCRRGSTAIRPASSRS